MSEPDLARIESDGPLVDNLTPKPLPDKESSRPLIGNTETGNYRLKIKSEVVDTPELEEEFKKEAGIQDSPQSNRWTEVKEKLDRFIESNAVVVFMTIVTFFVLFSNDVKYLLPISVDWTFNFLTLMAMILFFLELVISSVAKEGYFGSFFFWLDLVATLSFIFEIDWIFLAIIGGDSGLNLN